MIRGLEHLPCEDSKRAGVLQPGEEKAQGGPFSGLHYLKGAYRKSGEGLFIRACSNRTRENASKLEVHRFTVDIRILGSSSLL